LAFYDSEDKEDKVHGGLFHCLNDTGKVIDPHMRHIVSSTRWVVQYAWALLRFPGEAPHFRARLNSCMRFLRSHHLQSNGGYRWALNVGGGDEVALVAASHGSPDNIRAYGMAFAVLAYATALRAGLEEARVSLATVSADFTAHFWEEEEGLYADEATGDWGTTLPYRGSNANMHSLEAHLAAWVASREPFHLQRARKIAHSLCVRQAERVGAVLGEALTYEHYTQQWEPDFEASLDMKKDRFKPWGFQVGHLMELAKLLLQLNAHTENETPQARAWRLPTAERFFAAALRGWDEKHGGLAYSLAPTPGTPVCDNDKYKWVQAEAMAAAALLAVAVEKSPSPSAQTPQFYWGWYDRLWGYCWGHFIDHRCGAWFRMLNPDNSKHDDYKCPPGKVDYHSCGACYDVIDCLEA